MKFFTQYTYGSQAKNRAEKKADIWTRSLDGWLLADEKAKEEFTEEIKTYISRLNSEHPRCRNINVDNWDDSWVHERKEDTNTHVSVGDLCIIHIYPVKKEIH